MPPHDAVAMLAAAAPGLVERFALEPLAEEARAARIELYVVGGVVRDILLGRPVGEVDLAGPGDVMALARRFAHRMRGAFVPLDPAQGLARVVLGRGGQARHVDLARLRGADIAQDLALRDFRLDALAWPLAAVLKGNGAPLLDPTGGLEDLLNRVVEVTGDGSFVDDPLRMLRLFRIGAQLCFSPGPRALALARDQAGLVTRVAMERVTDEVVKTLKVAPAGPALERLAAVGLLERVMPVLPRPDEGIALTGRLEDLVNPFLRQPGPGSVGGATRPRAVPCVEVWPPPVGRQGRERLEAYLAGGAALDADVRVLLTLAGLLAGAGWVPPPGVRPRAMPLGMLRLATRDLERLVALAGGLVERAWEDWPADPSPLALHRFFRRHAPDGPGVIYLALASLPGGRATGSLVSALVAYAQRHDEVVAPPRLVDGRMVSRATGLAPGPAIGSLLTAIREAQVEGRVRDPEDALALARALAWCMVEPGHVR